MPQSEPTLISMAIESAIKALNKHFGPLLTACLTLSAALGVFAILSCGIPFVPPAGKLAVVLGVMGIIPAIVGMIVAWRRGGRTRVLSIIFGVLLFALNGFAIGAGQSGRHLIDYLEGH